VSGVRIARWAAWAPGIADADAWREWARAPAPLGFEGQPAVSFLPPLMRRRCNLLSRMMLEVAVGCCAEARLSVPACVFASRHGSVGTLVSLLEELAKHSPLSPAKFSHSVHNAQAGLFSIFAGNRAPSMSLAACEDTFAHGFLEALSALHRGRGEPVLFVVGDEPVPEPLGRLAEGQFGPYALALWLEAGDAVTLELGSSGGEPAARAWPDALEFLRWWISAERELRLAHPPREWIWRRSAGARPRDYSS